MKVLLIEHCYYLYPQQIQSLDEFAQYVNENTNRFIPLVQLLEENCVEPYFIESDTEKCYINLSNLSKIQEAEITLLTKEEYDERLSKVVQKTCIDCVSYSEDKMGDNLKGHRDKVNLDGKCFFKEVIVSED